MEVEIRLVADAGDEWPISKGGKFGSRAEASEARGGIFCR